MSRQHRAVPLLDLGRAVNAAVKRAPTPKGRKPTKAERIFAQHSRATPKERNAFHKLASETDFYQGRYTIRRVGDQYEVWDSNSSDVYGPYPTLGDARTAAEGL